MARRGAVLTVLIGLVAVSAPGYARDMSWQEAVTDLATERSLAETCAGALRHRPNPAEVRRWALVYGKAKAEIDGVISGLQVSLVKHQPPDSVPDLNKRLERAVEGRLSLCQAAEAIPGARLGLPDLLANTMEQLGKAVLILIGYDHEDDVVLIKTIGAQLEAAKWPAFDGVARP